MLVHKYVTWICCSVKINNATFNLTTSHFRNDHFLDTQNSLCLWSVSQFFSSIFMLDHFVVHVLKECLTSWTPIIFSLAFCSYVSFSWLEAVQNVLQLLHYPALSYGVWYLIWNLHWREFLYIYYTFIYFE